MTKQIKLADVFFEAANSHLCMHEYSYGSGSKYSCVAIVDAAKKLSGEISDVSFGFGAPVSERWIHHTVTNWSKKAKEKRPVVYAALKFAKDAGCPTGSEYAMKGVKQNIQDVRYQWLMTLAMLAKEEKVVVQCN